MPAELTLETLDPRLAELGIAADRVREHLVALEIDSDRELLERAALVGESAVRRAAANARIADLWRGLALLDALLDRARALRGSRRLRPAQLDELRGLLEGRSVELSSATVPLADRLLLGGVDATQRCSPAELLARMSDDFDIARAAVVEIGAAWERITPRLEAARRLLADAERRAADQGEPDRADLVDAARRLARLGAALSRDPLAVVPVQIEDVVRVLETISRDLDATAGLAREHVARLALARGLLADLRAVAQAGQLAHAELIVKVAPPVAAPAAALPTPTAPPPAYPRALEPALSEISALVDAGDWPKARPALDAWTAEARARLADARRALRECRAPIEARNRLRGLLDAYQVKAGRLGLIEDPDLAEVLARARHALYTAPTDLPLVDELVRQCQAALTGRAPRRVP